MSRAATWIRPCAGALLMTIGTSMLACGAVERVQTGLHQRHLAAALEEARATRTPVAAPALPAPGDPIGVLEIPRVGVKGLVTHGDDESVLRRAIGHLPDTPLPWQSGNTALAAHRDSWFRGLRHVRAGDRVRLATALGDFEYRVRNTLVVEPDAVWVLDPTAQSTLTLITCYPFDYVGPAPKRFIVRAERLDAPSGSETVKEDAHGDPLRG